MLSPQLLAILRSYWRLARPGHWLLAVTANYSAIISFAYGLMLVKSVHTT